MEQAESNLDSLRVSTTEKWFVQLGMAARGIACCSKCGEIWRLGRESQGEWPYAVRTRREAGRVRGAGVASADRAAQRTEIKRSAGRLQDGAVRRMLRAASWRR